MKFPSQVYPVIIGLEGTTLTEQERHIFSSKVKPLGVILFPHNIAVKEVIDPTTGEVTKEQDASQITTLIKEIKGYYGDFEALICIDQEGGRVQRFKSPTFQSTPAAKFFGNMAEELLKRSNNYEEKTDILNIIKPALDACEKNYELIGNQLKDIGVNLDFAPVADLLQVDTTNAIGDRSFGSNPDIVIALCKAAIQGLKKAGIIATLKHAPGHGRAAADSHKELPHVTAELEKLENTDFRIFRELSQSASLVMTAHVVYDALDSKNPATLSSTVVEKIKSWGYKHVVTDSGDMGALKDYTLYNKISLAFQVGCSIWLQCVHKNNMDDIKLRQELLEICQVCEGGAYNNLWSEEG